MEITAKINESMEDVYSSIKEMGYLSETRTPVGNSIETWLIQDENFPQSAAEILVVKSNEDTIIKIQIMTAWSGFVYSLHRGYDDKVWVNYDGAFKGFMEQVLLPDFTVDVDSIEEVYSTQLGHTSLNEYLIHRQKLDLFYRENNLPFGGWPRIFWGMKPAHPAPIVKKRTKN